MTWNGTNGKKNVYKGQLLANVFHGKGLLQLDNNDSYDGLFENGKFAGEGYYKWAHLPRLNYRGEFSNGKLHGNGTF